MARIKKLLKDAPRMRNSMPRKAQKGDSITSIKGSITPVPDGPLIKKKGRYAGSTLKNGGKTPAWTRSEGKDPKGGLNRKGVASYRRENPGSKLQMAVTTPPSKLKKGSKAAKRRKSFCARSAGQMAKFPKAAKDPNSRLRLARKKWNC